MSYIITQSFIFSESFLSSSIKLLFSSILLSPKAGGALKSFKMQLSFMLLLLLFLFTSEFWHILLFIKLFPEIILFSIIFILLFILLFFLSSKIEQKSIGILILSSKVQVVSKYTLTFKK